MKTDTKEVAVDIPDDEVDDNENDSKSPPESNALTHKPEKSKKMEYWKELNSALLSTSVRGLSRALAKKKKKYKVYWITVFIFAVIVFIINLTNITKRYVKDPILTQLEREEKPFTWPHFTFCNPANPIPFGSDPSLRAIWKSALKKAESDYFLPKYDPARNKKIWEHYMAISTINTMKFYSNIVNSSVFQLAVFYEDSSIVEYSSSIDLFHRVKDKAFVFDVRLYTIRSPIACFTLLPERLKAVVEGLRRRNHRLIGIKIYLLMDVKSYMTYDMGYENRKMYFYVTNPNTTILSQFPYYILPGTDTTFLMKERIHSRIARCAKKSFNFQLYDINMVTTWPFMGGFEDCRSFLSQEKFVTRCGCYNPYLPMYKFPDQQPILCTNMTLFDNATMTKNINCLNTVLKEKNHSDEFLKEVEIRCGAFHQNPCKETSYSVARYTTTWQKTMSPTRRKYMVVQSRNLPYAPENATAQFPRENLAILKLQWGKQKTEATFEQFEYPLSRFMSDFGGIVGLWIGLSVFSIFEFIEILYKFVKYKSAKS